MLSLPASVSDALEKRVMLSTVSSYPSWLSLMRSTPAFPFLDEFVTTLTKGGYHARTIKEHVYGAAHFSRWLEQRGQLLIEHGITGIKGFKRHFARCRCTGFKRVSFK